MSHEGKAFDIGERALGLVSAWLAKHESFSSALFEKQFGVTKKVVSSWLKGTRPTHKYIDILIKFAVIRISDLPSDAQKHFRAPHFDFGDGDSTNDFALHKAEGYCQLVFDADENKYFGTDLISPKEARNDPQEEGVLLIKPGGTFSRDCVTEIFRRIVEFPNRNGGGSPACQVVQIRVYDGRRVADGLFDAQYRPPMRIAHGTLELTDHDKAEIRRIYDKPEFKRQFGVDYCDDMIQPALRLCKDIKLSEEELTQVWEKGRRDNYNERRVDRINKIGYQKNVLAAELKAFGKVFIIVNGHIPGYKRLLTDADHRVVAIHVATGGQWSDIRDKLVGGANDPTKCARGSIRFDAWDRKTLKLDPADAPVDSQRNVCHCSATQLDGVNELMIWFECCANETLVGRLFEAHKINDEELQRYIENHLWDASWNYRDERIESLLFEFIRPRFTDAHNQGQRRFLEAIYRNHAGLNEDAYGLVREPTRVLVANGARYRVAGHDYFLHVAGKVLRPDNMSLLPLLDEIASDIRASLGAIKRPIVEAAVLAEAIRIAASDLRLLQLPVYAEDIANAELFRAEVIANLPLEALRCARRSEDNLIGDLQAQVLSEQPSLKSLPMSENDAWKEFERNAPPVNFEKKPPAVAVLLAGGRSTRMASTIPKPALPFDRRTWCEGVRDR